MAGTEWVTVVVMDDGDTGSETRVFGYSSESDARKDEDRVYEYVKARGYREEYEDYHVYLARQVEDPSGLDMRSDPGQFAGRDTDGARALGRKLADGPSEESDASSKAAPVRAADRGTKALAHYSTVLNGTGYVVTESIETRAVDLITDLFAVLIKEGIELEDAVSRVLNTMQYEEDDPEA